MPKTLCTSNAGLTRDFSKGTSMSNARRNGPRPDVLRAFRAGIGNSEWWAGRGSVKKYGWSKACNQFRNNHLLLYSWRFSRYSAPMHWLVDGHMTSNNETVSRQMSWAGNIAKTMTSNGKQFTVSREMLTAVSCDQRWPDIAGISTRFSIFSFVLFCYITNHLMTGTLRNSEFVSLDFVLGNVEILGKQNSLFPSGRNVLTILRDHRLVILESANTLPSWWLATNITSELPNNNMPWFHPHVHFRENQSLFHRTRFCTATSLETDTKDILEITCCKISINEPTKSPKE